MRIALFGTGYVGVVCAAGFADSGATVTCVDVDADRIARLARGDVPIAEAGLQEMVRRNLAAGRLTFATDADLDDVEVILVTVGTPALPDGGADTSGVEHVVRAVASRVRHPCVLVLRSTVPVGTHAKVADLLRDTPVRVVSNPEFVREGSAVEDFARPARVVLGIAPDDAFARRVMTRLYHPFMLSGDRFVWTDPASAELAKYATNAMLALRVAFMNDVAALCEALGADVHAVRHAVGSDPRIGPHHLHAGPGYGGSCLPKDVVALAHAARAAGVPLDIVEATDRANRRHRAVLAEKLRRRLGDLRGRRIAVWGLAFKPRTDDIRESPALDLLDALLLDGAVPTVHDPAALDAVRARYGDRVACATDAYEAARGAEALVLVTEWREYQNPDFARLRALMAAPAPFLLDGRNVWAAYDLPAQGFVYEGIGVR